MTNDSAEPFTSRWPGDPHSAWDEAGRSPGPIDRLDDPPDIDAADAASIADWIEDQRSLLPMFATIAAAVGAVLVGGLLLHILPLPDRGGLSSGAQRTGGICLLVASIVLWVWEIVSRRRRKSLPPRLIPEARVILCQLYPIIFHIPQGDGFGDTSVAIDADTPDAQAARVLTAFRIWTARLHANPDPSSQARDTAWKPADGWGVLVTPRRPKRHVGQLRFADIRQWTGSGWSL